MLAYTCPHERERERETRSSTNKAHFTRHVLANCKVALQGELAAWNLPRFGESQTRLGPHQADFFKLLSKNALLLALLGSSPATTVAQQGACRLLVGVLPTPCPDEITCGGDQGRVPCRYFSRRAKPPRMPTRSLTGRSNPMPKPALLGS